MDKSATIAAVLGKIKEQGFFNTITRYQYVPIDMDIALEVVEKIGKSRNPKFVIDDENRFTYENLIKWCHCDQSMQCIDPVTHKAIPANLKRGIYIAGNTGSGKSWALEIMAAYSMAYNFQIDLGRTERCLYWCNMRSDAICAEYTEQGSFERLKKMPIIGIQDLGTEQQESMYMGNRINVLRQILEYRGDRTDMMTLITSNLPMNHKKLTERYDIRVTSRLNEMCNYFEIIGKDRRKL